MWIYGATQTQFSAKEIKELKLMTGKPDNNYFVMKMRTYERAPRNLLARKAGR